MEITSNGSTASDKDQQERQTQDNAAPESIRNRGADLDLKDRTVEDDQGCLPDGWEVRKLDNGRLFYLNCNTNTTSWIRPNVSSQERPSEPSSPGPSGGYIKGDDLVPNQDPPSDTTKHSWKGWAELENDPVIFTTLLREWGIQGVCVREIIPLDAVFDTPASSTFGLIFLSRYIAPGAVNERSASPNDLWFANQTSSFSCATVALMNIVNNRPDVKLGDNLRTFKETTAGLSSKDRGIALDDFECVRDVHNSFATENDRMHVDMQLKEEAKAAAAKKRAQRSKKRRKGRKRKGFDDEDDSGLHFIAYVPAFGEVWRMDGLEREPSSLGKIVDAEGWLTMVVPNLEAQWQSAAMNELEFSLLSVVAEGEDLDIEGDEEKMKRARQDWGPMMAQFLRLHAERGDVADRLG